MIKNIDLSPGVLKHYDFDIDENKPFEEQSSSYREDMIQISFDSDKYLIDVGWYPESDENGCFKVYLIENCIWDNPLLVMECKKVKRVREIVEMSVSLFRYLVEEQRSNVCLFEVVSAFNVERGTVLVRNGGGILELEDIIIDISTFEEFNIIGTSHLYSSDWEHMQKLNETPPVLINDKKKEKHIGKLYVKK